MHNVRESLLCVMMWMMQEAELPELYNLLGVYAKGVYDYRYELLQRKRDWRSTRNKGLVLAFAIAVGDYIATVV